MPLTEAQRTQLRSVNTARLALASELNDLERLLRHVHDWDEGEASPLVPDDMTNDEAIAVFATEYGTTKAAIQTKVDDLP